ncbi:peroxiredoxin [Lysobacter oculi]|uniref:Glutathione-dependent peroxiredoxin n=1 Tax=Solilutibacter oculi TaxID=2698682 RepID=A0A344J8T7_9GAMM|nr:peroxiredoxin [Lysobacter oculi]AXA85447.1 peroxiredoxin [Lysobacter oculi]
MTIEAGQQVPESILQIIRTGVEQIDTHAVFGGKRVVMFAVPGAFTPTCSERHLPGYVKHFDDFRRKGVEVACVSVNDPFVMQAWGESQRVPEGMLMLADGNGELTRALGLQMDASAYGMGVRSKRYALYADNGVVKSLQVEAPGELRVSTAEHMLEQIS